MYQNPCALSAHVGRRSYTSPLLKQNTGLLRIRNSKASILLEMSWWWIAQYCEYSADLEITSDAFRIKQLDF